MNFLRPIIFALIAFLWTAQAGSLCDYGDFVQCGFLLPITAPPEKELEFTGTYLLRASLPDGVRQLSLTYEFRRLQ